MSERESWIELIRNEYDPRPNLGRGDYPAFEWDDGAGRIADAIMAEIERLRASPAIGATREEEAKHVTRAVLAALSAGGDNLVIYQAVLASLSRSEPK